MLNVTSPSCLMLAGLGRSATKRLLALDPSPTILCSLSVKPFCVVSGGPMKQLTTSILCVLLAGLALLAGCSSTPEPSGGAQSTSTPAQPKPPSLYTGIQAFSCVNGIAQRW